MSEQKKYTALDIERYHNGTMSERERYEMEKAALEDAFLADAMEGFATTTSAKEDLEELNERIDTRIIDEKKRVIPLYKPSYNWLKVAAVLILVAGGTLIYYNQTKNIAATTAIAKKEAAPLKKDSLLSFKTDSVGTGTYTWTTTNGAVASKSNSLQGTTTYYSTDSTQLSAANQFLSVSPNAAAITKTPLERQLEMKPAGKITDSVDLSLAANNKGADHEILPKAEQADDKFAVKLAKDKDSQRRDYAANGIVNISQSNTLKEAVITSNRVSKKQRAVALYDMKTAGKQDSVADEEYKVEDFLNKDAQPVIGWVAYNDYLKKNKRLYAVDSLPANEAVVIFTVHANGRISNISIESTINDEYDAEAIRLVKEGPAWKSLSGKKARIRVLVTF